ncbi:hypothetical protein KZX46_14815 [Polymorphobacter sp. PAMC 29334]|uniref:PEP-CTERM sorting domain-containing protein n=1 Tax=Polymorphobacter sp. PAMC 29334 TaxID=2862331 RepID=UPI001C7434E7|nr:PEP-CTERM sorting domain-containing protein [Polymorphobacter sp. PAMC 29334]QYE34066.1 hypothetical protein KZX46_14815 [Polymorphobacter sp. PAMC 29334]
MSVLSKITMISLAAAGSLALATPAAAVTEIFASYLPTAAGSNMRYQKTGVGNGLIYTVATPKSSSLGSTAVKFSFIGGPLASLGILDGSFVFSGIATDNPALSLGGLVIQTLDSGFFGFTYTGATTLHVGSKTYTTGANLLSGSFTGGQIFGTARGSSGSVTASTPPVSAVQYSSDFRTFDPLLDKDFALALTAITPFLSRLNSDNSINSFRAVSTGAFSTEVAAVPEPQVWGLLVAGFGLVGVRLRRRHNKVFAC